MSTVHTVSLTGLVGHVSTFTATAVVDRPAITFIGNGHCHFENELRDRVHAALANSGRPHRNHSVEVDLGSESAPSAAAVAVAILAATADIPACRLAGTAVLGEVGLDGSMRATLGVLPAVQAAHAHGLRRVIVPATVLGQAALVDGIDVLGADSLTEIADWLRGNDTALHTFVAATSPVTDGQCPPKRALAAQVLSAVEVAASGGHHLLLDAVDSVGTFLAAQWLHHLLPDLTVTQQHEIAAIRSLTGPLRDPVLNSAAPLVNAHPGNSLTSLMGNAAPGAVSQAHHGVLVACDLADFSGAVLDSLHRALLHRDVTLTHDGRSLRYPAGFQLFATYIRTSGTQRSRRAMPLLDSLDIRLTLTTAGAVTSRRPDADEPDHLHRLLVRARTRVGQARARAAARWSKATEMAHSGHEVTNALVPHEMLHALPGTAAANIYLDRLPDADTLSPHGRDVVVRLAWSFPG